MKYEDEMVAKLEANDRASKRLLVGFFVLILICGGGAALAFLTGNGALIQGTGFQVGISVLLICGLILLLRKFGPATFDVMMEDSDVLRRRIDAHHRYWRWNILCGLFAATSMSASLSFSLAKMSLETRPYVLLFGAAVVAILILFTAVIAVGPGWSGIGRHNRDVLNDEFTTLLRGRMAKVGHGTMMLATGGALMTCLLRPSWTAPALLWALYAGYAVPALYYLIADWRAGKEG